MKIRKAVGAVVFQNNEYLLVHKVKSISNNENIIGHWDFPKGGVKESDQDLEAALLRELKEETGSDNYRIISKFDKKICFTFHEAHKYDSQETSMFYVEYLGYRGDLKSRDEEIDKVQFFSKEDLIRILELEETRKFLNEEFF
ncbi:NUDIX hydrolase [Desnuesiella massiliensis]|uniref:NUDIX hydrolase n=1 Tax=Desnuesiella massiliensis TaxID=1650662 RepID=UPI0006E3FA97|nr:NUDIX hydrolase [Desnuesiella massiliensis]